MAQSPKPGEAASKSGATATRETDQNQTRATQPTINMAPAPNRPGDPVTNAAEKQMQDEQNAEQQRQEEEAIKQQEEEAKRQQELFEMRQNLMTEIIKSPEGFVEGNEDNNEAITEASREGFIYQSNVQSGPGGLEVSERWYLSQKGYDALRTSLGPNMGK